MILDPDDDLMDLLGWLAPQDIQAINRFRLFLREVDKPKCICNAKDEPHWHIRRNTWRYVQGEEVDPDGPWELT